MTDTHETDQLLRRVADGDDRATSELLQRHQQRLRRMVTIRLDDRQTGVSGVVMRQELNAQIRTALSHLASNHREILVLLFLERLSMAEAAAVLGVSQEAARSRQRRALEQFGRLARPLVDGQEQ